MSVTKIGSYTGARPDVVEMLSRPPARSLDVGCSNGELSANLAAFGTETWGIELDPDLAAVATDRLAHVRVGDALEQLSQLVAEHQTFDAVICADSLEHMTDPWKVLKGVRDLTKADGEVIVSLPNVRFYTTLVSLIFRGEWRYLDRGVHDRTHLRWFTDANARQMFADAGFRVEDALTHYRLFDRPAPLRNRPAKYLAVGPLRGFLAYQYVYRLRPV